jgi:DNA-directed RNA polymerase specialized sigma24 family protein
MRDMTNKDFFISYHHYDQSWAEWIAWELEDAAYTTIIQAWDFAAGTNFILSMDDALMRAPKVLVVLSPNYLESAFAKSEWAGAFVRDAASHQRRVVPVRVAPCHLGGLLASIVYLDLVGKDETTAREVLLATVKDNRKKPSAPPRFPAAAAPRFPGTPPCTPTPAGPSSPEPRPKLMMVLTGTIDELDKPLIETLLAHLRKLSQDASLTLSEIHPGSIILIIEATEDGIRRLEHVLSTGALTMLGDHRILQTSRAAVTLSPASIEELLAKARTGNHEAVNLLLMQTFPEFQKLAARLLRRQAKPDVDVDALVHETYLHILQGGTNWQNRQHFFAVGGSIMRRLLIDQARAQGPQTPRPLDPVDLENLFAKGATHDEIARLLNVDERTARRYSALARAWLQRHIEGTT